MRRPPLTTQPQESRYFNRELSQLDFQERVLALAENPSLPLLERVKFIAIVSGNLDEFFQVRVAGLMEQKAAGVRKAAADGRTPGQQLDEIADKTQRLVARKERVFLNEIVPALESVGIRLTGYDDLDTAGREMVDNLFETEMYPVLTPLAVDPAHPFPYISNLSLNLAVRKLTFMDLEEIETLWIEDLESDVAATMRSLGPLAFALFIGLASAAGLIRRHRRKLVIEERWAREEAEEQGA